MDNLNWELANVKFTGADHKQVYVAKVYKDFTMEELRKEYQALSDRLNKESVHSLYIACAVHYNKINKWTAGQATKCGQTVELVDISYNQAFDDSDIDGVEIYIVTDNDFNPTNHMIHPKKSSLEYPSGSMFEKHNKKNKT
jgi:hypothetical protein